jgi:hypothetical protein
MIRFAVVCGFWALAAVGCNCDETEEESVCPIGQVQVDGVCQEPVCQPSRRVCVGAQEVQICNADGSGTEVVACPDDRSCVDGSCVNIECTPREIKCDEDGTRWVCRDDGQQWDPYPCPEGNACFEDEGAINCVPRSCEPGATRCVVHGERSPSLQVCNPSGTAFLDERCNTALNEVCMEVDGVAGCHRRICIPEETGCANRRTIGVCNATGTGWIADRQCDQNAGEVCAQGRCVSACELAMGNSSYMGCEFFAVEMANLTSGSFAMHPYALVVANPNENQVSVSVTHKPSVNAEPVFAVVLSNHNAQGTSLNSEVRDSNRQVVPGQGALTGPAESVAIPAGGTATLLVREQGGGRFNIGPTGPNQTGTGVDARSFRVDATLPVIVYQFNPLCCNNNHTNDASLLLPVSGMGQAYHAFAGPSWSFGSNYPGTFTVVAARDNTAVTIDVSGAARHNMPTLPNLPAPDGDGRIEVTLNQYGTINLISGAGGDLTGVRVEASKPVGAFGGHMCTQIPFGDVACDHIEEQLLPDETWGARYAAVPFHFRNPNRGNETSYYRVMANADGAEIHFDPEWTAVVAASRSGAAVYAPQNGVRSCSSIVQNGVLFLGPDENCEFNTQISVLLEAEQRFGVTQFMSGQASTGGQNHAGDPAMMVVPPRDQFRNRYMFLTPQTYYVDYLNLVGPENAVYELDGAVIDNTACQELNNPDEAPCVIDPWAPIGNGEIGHMVIRMNDGPHLVESRSGEPFGIMVYAYDNYVSYAYPGGLDLTKY